jgi:hypothetical protein
LALRLDPCRTSGGLEASLPGRGKNHSAEVVAPSSRCARRVSGTRVQVSSRLRSTDGVRAACRIPLLRHADQPAPRPFPRHTVEHRCASASPSACPEKVAACLQIPQAVVSAFGPWREIDREDLRSGSDRLDSGTRGSGIARQRKALRTFAGTKGRRTSAARHRNAAP